MACQTSLLSPTCDRVLGRNVTISSRFRPKPPGKRVVTLLHLARDSLVAKLTVGTRYLKGQLSAHGVKVPLSEGCLKDFVRNASEPVVQTQQRGESYISCLGRHLDARARFILLWTSSDEAFDREVWADLVAMAQKHALPRAWSPQLKRVLPERANTRREAISDSAQIRSIWRPYANPKARIPEPPPPRATDGLWSTRTPPADIREPSRLGDCAGRHGDWTLCCVAKG